MIDIEFVRQNPDRMREVLRQKNVELDLDDLLELDERRRARQTELDDIQRQRNEHAQSITGKPSAKQLEHGRDLKQRAAHLEKELNDLEQEFTTLAWQIPNVPSEDTPVGRGEEDNVPMRVVDTKPDFDFTPKPHWELGEALDLIDTQRAGQVAGSRFTYLKNELVWLQFALLQFALSVLTDEKKLFEIARAANLRLAEDREKVGGVQTTPFTPMIVPVMVRPEVFAQMGRLEPREERYYIPTDDLYLVGSAEHTLGPLHAGEVLSEQELPKRYVGYSTSFRREAGSHGKDVRGILRLHQFDKLEIESFTTPGLSEIEQDFILAIQEHLMQSLKLPYQVILKCTGDMGAPNYRAIDIETWMPGQGMYRETHTADHMADYQARRLHTKFRDSSGKTEYVHMNDATVFAIGRTLIAIMENYQQADGSIRVPEVLQQYVPFSEIKK